MPGRYPFGIACLGTHLFWEPWRIIVHIPGLAVHQTCLHSAAETWKRSAARRSRGDTRHLIRILCSGGDRYRQWPGVYMFRNSFCVG